MDTFITTVKVIGVLVAVAAWIGAAMLCKDVTAYQWQHGHKGLSVLTGTAAAILWAPMLIVVLAAAMMQPKQEEVWLVVRAKRWWE